MAHHDQAGERAGKGERKRFWRVAAAEAAAWTAICFGVWVLTLSALSAEDASVAAGVACVCGLFAVAGRRAIGETWAPLRIPLRALVRLAGALVADTAAVLATPLRRNTGSRFSRVHIDGAAGTGSRAAARRARATLLDSLSPGSFVCDIDASSGEALVHRLGGRKSELPDS